MTTYNDASSNYIKKYVEAKAASMPGVVMIGGSQKNQFIKNSS
jgi:hypothetical protein